ncbi:hypothetical protein ACQEU6_29150 [Spirillospora sp. CA-108201]
MSNPTVPAGDWNDPAVDRTQTADGVETQTPPPASDQPEGPQLLGPSN